MGVCIHKKLIHCFCQAGIDQLTFAGYFIQLMNGAFIDYIIYSFSGFTLMVLNFQKLLNVIVALGDLKIAVVKPRQFRL